MTMPELKLGALREALRKVEISERDRRALILLGILVVAVGYYLYLFEPIYAAWEDSGDRLGELRMDILKTRRKVREIDAWYRDRQALSRQLGEIGARISVPAPDAEVYETTDAILAAALAAGVEVNAIRPLVGPAEDASAEVVDTFDVEGTGTAAAFMRFVTGIWGLHIEDVSLNQTSRGSSQLRFYLRASLLPYEDFELIRAARTQGHSPAELRLAADPFSRKQPASRPRPAAPPPPPRTLNLSGLQLVGIAEVGGEKVAALIDGSGDDNLLLRVGDSARAYTIDAIDDAGITLKDGELTGRLELPDRSAAAPVATSVAGGWVPSDAPVGEGIADPSVTHEIPPPPAYARLGLGVLALTPLLAEDNGLYVSEGLLVTRGRPDAPEIRVGDVIETINDVEVHSMDELLLVLSSFEPGAAVILGLVRDLEVLQISLITW